MKNSGGDIDVDRVCKPRGRLKAANGTLEILWEPNALGGRSA
jgi:hypothetical protein